MFNWKILVLIACEIAFCTSCYRMPCGDEDSVIPVINNRDLTQENNENVLPTMNY